jgi:hypothetical protein
MYRAVRRRQHIDGKKLPGGFSEKSYISAAGASGDPNEPVTLIASRQQYSKLSTVT